jgi:RNA polymerase sigma factor (sigma-70 family)
MFTAIYEKHSDDVRRYVRAALRRNGLSITMAEDIVQQTFLDLMSDRGTIWKSEGLLFVIAKRRVRDAKRTDHPAKSLGERQVCKAETEPSGTLMSEPEAQCERVLLTEKLQAAIQELSPSLQSAITAICLRKLSYKEAAKELGIPVNRLGVQVSRAMCRLRERMAV